MLISRGQVYYWINTVKLGRKDLTNIPLPGRDPDQALPAYVAETHAVDPNLLVKWITKTLNIGSTMVRHYDIDLEDEMLSYTMSPTNIDGSSKIQKCVNHETHVIGAGEAPDIKFSFPSYKE
jgi:hypothetical protein